MGCNGTQNEKGGKDLLLKMCVAVTAATTDESESVTISGHGLKLNDLVKFGAVGANTVIDTDTYYFVVEIVDANNVKISATPGGTAIEMDATVASMAADVFKSIGGIRGKAAAFSSDGIDVTNQDSDQWQVLLDGAGIRSCEISGDGVYTNEAMAKLLEDRFVANLLTCLAVVEVVSGRVYAGCFKITSLEVGGAYDGEGTMSMSGSSSGPVDIFRAA